MTKDVSLKAKSYYFVDTGFEGGIKMEIAIGHRLLSIEKKGLSIAQFIPAIVPYFSSLGLACPLIFYITSS